MWSIAAHDRASLRELSDAVHDAHVDGDLERNADAVVVPLLQQGWAGGPPAEELFVRETWRYREHRVTFFRGRLVIREVREMHAPDAWGDRLMIFGVDFDPHASAIHVRSCDDLRVDVAALDVMLEITDEPGGYARRRVGRYTGIVSERWR